MIVEPYGRNDVLVRHRDTEGRRVETRITDYLPWCYVSKESSAWVEGRKTDGYRCVFGEDLVKVETFQDYDIGQMNRDGETWEANVPFTNKVLADRVKRGGAPIPNYRHRVWYLDGEWKISTGEITLLTVYDSFKETMWTWLTHPDVPVGRHDSLPCKNHPEGLESVSFDTPVIAFANERDLLTHFTLHMGKCDPDIITGWFVVGADIKQIAERMNKVGLSPNRMSPMNRFRYDFGDWAQPIPGRNCIDLMLAFSKLYEMKNGKLSGYKLDDVADEVLDERKVELTDGHDTYYTDIGTYTDYNRQDVRLLPRLDAMVNALDYFIAVQHIAQCEIRSTPHITQVFTNLVLSDPKVDFQLPSKARFPKERYSGGIVMEGKPGIHDNVGIFDIRAMYHSNVNLHNISWDTLDANGVDCGNGVRFAQDRQGLLGRHMDRMTELRNDYKAQMKSCKTEQGRVKYDTLQFAAKTLVASMYGVAGDAKYSLYHPEIAASITHASRNTLIRLKDEVEKRGFPVVYGHTDSVMCIVPSPEEGLRVLADVNASMAPIEVEFEKWSSRFMLMEKNRYCGLVTWTDGESHKPQRYVKGIEMKQARMPALMKNAMGQVIDGILTGEDEGNVTNGIVTLIDSVISNEADTRSLCMKGKITKNLEDYSSLSGSSAGAAWANRVLGKGYRKDDHFLVAIAADGQYMAFDDPADIEGIAEIGLRVMCERFIVNKIQPYYLAANWDFGPVLRALDGKSRNVWL